MIAKTLYWTGRLVVNNYARTMLTMDIRYQAKVPDGAKIIAPNHPTTVDPFVSLTLLHEQAHILISETLFKVPVFSNYLRQSGHVPVIVKDGKTAFEAALNLLRDGKTVVIFPEGALSPREGGLQRLHTGVARLALMTGAPVIPVGIGLARERIRYIETLVDDQPETAYGYFRGPYAVTIGAAMYLTGDVEDRDYVHAQMEQIGEQISYLIGQSERRLQAAACFPRRTRRVPVRRYAQRFQTVFAQSGKSIGTSSVRVTKRLAADARRIEWSRLMPEIHLEKLNADFARRYFRGMRGMVVH